MLVYRILYWLRMGQPFDGYFDTSTLPEFAIARIAAMPQPVKCLTYGCV